METTSRLRARSPAAIFRQRYSYRQDRNRFLADDDRHLKSSRPLTRILCKRADEKEGFLRERVGDVTFSRLPQRITSLYIHTRYTTKRFYNLKFYNLMYRRKLNNIPNFTTKVILKTYSF